jgi:hypothetical protein
MEGGRDAISAVCSRIYCMGHGKERRSNVTIRNDEGGQRNTRNEEKLAGTSTEDVIRKSSEATFIYYHPIGKRDPGRPRRRRLDVSA